jgi:hypothetical protein
MKYLRIIAVAFILAAPLTARACPLCSEMVANASENKDDGDVDQFPMAVNQSIYLMLAVPYTAFGVMGFLVYRGIRKNDAYRQSVTEQPSPDQIATPAATVS